jgi:hypothetical protein
MVLQDLLFHALQSGPGRGPFVPFNLLVGEVEIRGFRDYPPGGERIGWR